MPCNLAVYVLNFNSLSVHQKNGEGPIWCCIFNFIYKPTSYTQFPFGRKKKKGEGELLMTDYFSMKYTLKKKKRIN